MDETIFNYRIDDGFLWSEVNLKGNKKYYVEGYASTIDKDLSGEVVDYSAQEDIYAQIKGRNITLDLEHEEWYDEEGKLLPKPKNQLIPVAKVVDAELRPQGVWVKAEINPHLSKFQEVWGSIKDGFLKAFSIAFYPVAKAGNIIQKLNLVNITLTGSPVNPGATFSASMKSAQAWLDSIEKNKQDEVPTMVDEIIKQDVIEPVAAEVKAEPVAEVKVEEPVVAEVKAEPKNDEELEKLVAEIKALREENIKLKADLEKPVMKAVMETAPSVPKTEQVYISPLQLVK